jgi:hypothetical protein
MELIYIAGIFLFFALIVGLAHGCAKRGGPGKLDSVLSDNLA